MDCFIGIGAQKAGTTWLAEFLTSHPEVAMSPMKELHFFDQYYATKLCGNFEENFTKEVSSIENAALLTSLSEQQQIRCQHLKSRLAMKGSHDKYRDYLFALKNSTDRITGEITPSYSLLGEAGFEAINTTLPDVKIIFMLRDPVQRYWSQCKYHQLQHPAYDALTECLPSLQSPHFSLRTDYARTFEGLDAVFSEDQVHIIFYEDLFLESTSQGVVSRLCSFLGISESPFDAAHVINPSPRLALPFAHGEIIGKHFSHVYAAVRERFGAQVPHAWSQF